MFGYRMRNGVRVGYSFTTHTGGLGSLTNGSHEAFLGYDFTLKLPPKPQKRILTPGIFKFSLNFFQFRLFLAFPIL